MPKMIPKQQEQQQENADDSDSSSSSDSSSDSSSSSSSSSDEDSADGMFNRHLFCNFYLLFILFIYSLLLQAQNFVHILFWFFSVTLTTFPAFS